MQKGEKSISDRSLLVIKTRNLFKQKHKKG